MLGLPPQSEPRLAGQLRGLQDLRPGERVFRVRNACCPAQHTPRPGGGFWTPGLRGLGLP